MIRLFIKGQLLHLFPTELFINWAWWKSQLDVDRRPLENLSLVDVLRFSSGRPRPDCQTEVFKVDVDQTDLFNWSTSTAQKQWLRLSTTLRFSNGRRRPDWGFLLVDVEHWSFLIVDVLVDSRPRKSTIDTIDAVDVSFYWLFHHAP